MSLVISKRETQQGGKPWSIGTVDSGGSAKKTAGDGMDLATMIRKGDVTSLTFDDSVVEIENADIKAVCGALKDRQSRLSTVVFAAYVVPSSEVSCLAQALKVANLEVLGFYVPMEWTADDLLWMGETAGADNVQSLYLYGEMHNFASLLQSLKTLHDGLKFKTLGLDVSKLGVFSDFLRKNPGNEKLNIVTRVSSDEDIQKVDAFLAKNPKIPTLSINMNPSMDWDTTVEPLRKYKTTILQLGKRLDDAPQSTQQLIKSVTPRRPQLEGGGNRGATPAMRQPQPQARPRSNEPSNMLVPLQLPPRLEQQLSAQSSSMRQTTQPPRAQQPTLRLQQPHAPQPTPIVPRSQQSRIQQPMQKMLQPPRIPQSQPPTLNVPRSQPPRIQMPSLMTSQPLRIQQRPPTLHLSQPRPPTLQLSQPLARVKSFVQNLHLQPPTLNKPKLFIQPPHLPQPPMIPFLPNYPEIYSKSWPPQRSAPSALPNVPKLKLAYSSEATPRRAVSGARSAPSSKPAYRSVDSRMGSTLSMVAGNRLSRDVADVDHSMESTLNMVTGKGLGRVRTEVARIENRSFGKGKKGSAQDVEASMMSGLNMIAKSGAPAKMNGAKSLEAVGSGENIQKNIMDKFDDFERELRGRLTQ